MQRMFDKKSRDKNELLLRENSFCFSYVVDEDNGELDALFAW